MRIYLPGGDFKTLVVDSNLQTNDCIKNIREKLALTSLADYSGFTLFESLDGGKGWTNYSLKTSIQFYLLVMFTLFFFNWCMISESLFITEFITTMVLHYATEK